VSFERAEVRLRDCLLHHREKMEISTLEALGAVFLHVPDSESGHEVVALSFSCQFQFGAYALETVKRPEVLVIKQIWVKAQKRRVVPQQPFIRLFGHRLT
jgi:hypothetical protein